jgi:sugar diacid utilization regulator
MGRVEGLPAAHVSTEAADSRCTTVAADPADCESVLGGGKAQETTVTLPRVTLPVNPQQESLGAIHVEAVEAFTDVVALTTRESPSLDTVLRAVGRRLCELVGVSRCSVYLRDEEGTFRGKVGYCVGRGNIDASIRRLVAGTDQDRFTQEVVATKAPVVIQDAASDARTIQRTMRLWGVRDMLGVPLVVDEQVIGIMFVDNQGEYHGFTEYEIGLAQTFAGLSALAIKQSWLYHKLEERAKLIEVQRRALVESGVVHGKVTEAALAGAEVEQLVELVSELLGKPVTLYGPALDVVCWAAPPRLELAACPGLTRRQRTLPAVADAMRSLLEHPTAMLPPGPDTGMRRLIARMTTGTECLGYLELAELGMGFTPADPKALEQATLAIALKLVADRHDRKVEKEEREAFFADLLYGRREPEALAAQAPRYGFDINRRYLLIRLQYHDRALDPATDLRRRDGEIAAEIARVATGGSSYVAQVCLLGADLVLIEEPVPSYGGMTSPVVERMRPIFQRLQSEYGARYIVVSDACTSIESWPVMTERLVSTVRLLRETSTSPCVAYARTSDLLRMILHREGVHGAIKQAHTLLQPVVDHDEAAGGALIETLSTFIECQAQIRATACQLGVHENTVRYRLHRIREISMIEPERLDGLLVASASLQLRVLFASSPFASSPSMSPGVQVAGA